MSERLDLDAIGKRLERANSANATTLEVLLVVDDAARLLAEVRRLEAALADAAEAHNKVFNLWEEESGESARLRAEVRRLQRQLAAEILAADEEDGEAE